MEDHRNQLEKFKSLDLQRTHFLEELLTELTKTRDELRQVKLDLLSETEARRKWQEELKVLKESETEKGRNGYAVVLIDGDSNGYIFKNCILSGIDDAGEKAGEKAADSLYQAVRSYLGKQSEAYNDLRIVVKVYANVDGRAHSLAKGRLVDSVAEFRSFVTGFNNRLPFCDFIDVGYGKERADNKIREALKFYADSWQCKHILVGCHYDTGYSPFLGQFAAEKRFSNRITLIEGGLPLQRLKGFDFQTVRLDHVFHSEQRNATRSPVTLPAPDQPYHNQNAKPERLGPVLRVRGRRVDRPLRVRPEVVKQFERANLCHWLFLRGECREKCSRSHTYRPLTDEELDALWLLSRRGRCFKARKDALCDDDKCIYGHS